MMWFRFYSGALDDPKVQRLTGDLFKVWVNLLCLANEAEERGALPLPDDIAFRLRLDFQKAEDAMRGLVRAGLLDEDAEGGLHIHGWETRQKKSDDVTARVHKHRNKGNDIETLPKRFCNALEESREEESREEKSRPEERAPEPPQRPAPTPRRAGARATLDGYAPSAAFRDAALQEQPWLDFAAVTENWRDWHRAKGDTIRDFDASLRTWLRREREPTQPRAAPLATRPSNEAAKFDRTVAALRGVGGHREPPDIPDQPCEARLGPLRRDHA